MAQALLSPSARFKFRLEPVKEWPIGFSVKFDRFGDDAEGFFQICDGVCHVDRSP